jgi:hypothetical protein
MKRSFVIAMVLFSSAALVGAQAPAPPSDAKPAPSPQPPAVEQPSTQQPAPSAPAARPADQAQKPMSQASADRVTFSGCLKPGATPGTYILTDATEVRAGAAASPAARGTTGATKSFNLTAVSVGEDLSKHLNHKIEVSGTVAASRVSPGASAAAPGAEKRPEGAPAAEGLQKSPTDTLSFQTFKMVSPACP